MWVAWRGELIARMGGARMIQDRLGAESLKGLLTHAVIARLRTDERRQELIDTLRRRGLAVTLNWNRERGVRAKSRARFLP
jgi:hypothetical protein